MNERLINSTAYPLEWEMVLTSDHLSEAVGKTVVVQISKNGGPYIPVVGSVFEIGFGTYGLDGAVGDRDTLGDFVLGATATGVDTQRLKGSIKPYDPYATPPTPQVPVVNVTQTNTNSDDLTNQYLKVIANANLPEPERFP